MRNRCQKVAQFSEAKFRQVLKCFSLDMTASDTAKISGLSRNTINSLFNLIRECSFVLAQQERSEWESFGVFECDESYLGANTFVVKEVVELLEKRLFLACSNVKEKSLFK